MTKEDKKQFLEVLNALAAVFRTELNTTQLEIYWATLKDISIDEFKRASTSILKTAKFFPVPAEILELVPSNSGNRHIGPDEAWAVALESFDEDATVAMTQQIAEARGVALPIWDSGDEVGARMAFRSAYSRLIANADKPKWYISLGHCSATRESGIRKAVDQGRITNDQAITYLPYKYAEPKPENLKRLIQAISSGINSQSGGIGSKGHRETSGDMESN